MTTLEKDTKPCGVDAIIGGSTYLLSSDRYYGGADGRIYDGKKNDKVICNHLILPICQLEDVYTGDVQMEIAFKDCDKWKTVVASRQVIATEKIKTLADKGVDVTSENHRALSTYLIEIARENQDHLKIKKSVCQVGWIKDGNETAFFPYSGGTYTFGGNDDFCELLNSIHEHGDHQTWVDTMRGVRNQKSSLPVRLSVATSFASVLLEPCQALPFFLHLWGGSENGKTVALMCAASVWGDPQKYYMSFNATAVGLEKRASFLNHLPMCIDELQIKSAQGINTFDDMIYMMAEGTGRTRGTKDGGLQKETHWRSSFITTGEQPLTSDRSAGGAVNRKLELLCSERVCADPRALYLKIIENYGSAGRVFVDHLLSVGWDEVRRLQNDFYEQLKQTDCTDKQAVSASVILAADELATRWIFQDGAALTAADMKAVLKTRKEVDANERAFDFLLQLIESNSGHFAENPQLFIERWGWYKGDDICIIKRIFDREIESGSYDPAALLAFLKEKDLVLCDKGRRTKKERFSGSRNGVDCVRLIGKKLPANSADPGSENVGVNDSL